MSNYGRQLIVLDLPEVEDLHHSIKLLMEDEIDRYRYNNIFKVFLQTMVELYGNHRGFIYETIHTVTNNHYDSLNVRDENVTYLTMLLYNYTTHLHVVMEERLSSLGLEGSTDIMFYNSTNDNLYIVVLTSLDEGDSVH